MSTGTDNFITLDSITEIQDIVNGDFIFTISNGIIYKLDFQNFIISRDNTDFFTLIDSLSAQVVTNTQSLCAINAYINDNKGNVSGLLELSSLFTELSAGWQSTYLTTQSLSTYTWLPLPTEDEPFNSGAMIYYNGTAGDWKPVQPGVKNNVLTVDPDTGLPVFGGGDSLGTVKLIAEGIIEVYNNQNITSSTRFPNTRLHYVDETVTLANITDVYSYVQIDYSIIPDLTININTSITQALWSNQSVELYNNGNPILNVIQNGNKNDELPMNITAKVTGTITPAINLVTQAVIKLKYTITGTKIN